MSRKPPTDGRRPNGAGSVFWRPERSRWMAQLTYKGGLITRTVPKALAPDDTPASRRRATEWLRAWIARIDRGEPAKPDRTLLSTYLREWLVSVRLNRAPNTYLAYVGAVNRLCDLMPRTRLGSVDRGEIEGALASMGKVYASKTVVSTKRVLSAALNEAVKRGLLPNNPAARVAVAASHKSARPVISDVDHFADLVAGTNWEYLLTVAVFSGCRIGELLALRWSDVDLDARRLTVRSSITRTVAGPLARADTKTHRGRLLVLPERAVDALRKQRTRVAEQRLAAHEWADLDLVFPSPSTGRLVRSETILRSLQRAVKADRNLAGMRTHDLRHSFATLLLKAGVALPVVSEMLGHSSIAITADVYQHVSESMQRGAADALDRLTRPKNGSEIEAITDKTTVT